MFEEQRAGEVSDFISLFQLDLVAMDRYFTFSELRDAPDYSLAGATYLGAAAIKTFAGPPWEVMGENKLIFNFETGRVAPIESVTISAPVSSAGNYIVSPGLIMPGSLTNSGSRISDYVGWFYKETMRFKYSEVTYA